MFTVALSLILKVRYKIFLFLPVFVLLNISLYFRKLLRAFRSRSDGLTMCIFSTMPRKAGRFYRCSCYADGCVIFLRFL